MKYIDLHCHLDGCITKEIAKDLAKMQKITLPEDEELSRRLTVKENCADLGEFLERFALPCSLLQTGEALQRAAFLILENMVGQGVAYAELRFAPQKHTERGMSQKEAVEAVLCGIKEAKIPANLILCCMRGEDEAKNRETVALAGELLREDGGVVALDLAGAEALFPTKDYEKLFAAAREAGVPFTIHAGEADGAESIRRAVEYGAVRIGHGVRAKEDETVLDLLVKSGIALELCPTSNYATQAIKQSEKFPLAEYLARGIKVTVNTDDPAILGTDIGAEFALLKKHGLSFEGEKTCLKNAVEAAFTTKERKEEILREIFG